MEEGVKGEHKKVFPHASVLFSRAKLPIWKRALPPRPQPANFRNRTSLRFRRASGTLPLPKRETENGVFAKPTVPDSLLQMNIDYACSHVDCSVIQTGGECQLIDTIMNHASVAMNLFLQASNRTDISCHFKSTGMIVIEDPTKYIWQSSA
ncbi:hypothetical protein ACLB2K_032975 [Fragaria x ananassa]